MFLIENLWHIFEVAKEERTDEDDFSPDMGPADSLFVNAVEGFSHYKCLDKLDLDALRAAWLAEDQGAAGQEYNAIMGNESGCYAELAEAFREGDREAFERIKAEWAAAHGE